MSLFKRITAGLTAFSLAAVCTGCKSTTVAMTIGDYTVPAGVYIYYLNSAYNQALSQLPEDYPDLDTTDVKAVKECFLEGKDVRTWAEDKAIEFCLDFVATEQKFDELGLELDSNTKNNINSMMDYYWSSYEKDMTANGISQESFKKVMTSSYKSQEIFDYYYAPDGAEGVTEDELKEYYIENHIRAQYISFDLHDSEGNLLKSNGKEEVKQLTVEYQKRLEQAYQSGGAEAVMKEMDAVTEDYAAYQEEKAAEEAAAADEEAAALESEAAAEDTSAETEADADAEDESVVEESAAAYDAPKVLTLEEFNAPEENMDVPDEEDVNAETAIASDEDGNPDIDGDVETTPIEPRTIDENADLSDDEEVDSELIDDEYAIEPISLDDGEPIAVDDSALEEEDDYIPYQNERIITVINPDDYEDDEEIRYTPDETVYNKLTGIQEADYGKVYFVEEDEVYYLVVRYDITERMTEDDLWTESAVENVAYDKYYDAFEELMDGWSASLSVSRNESAIKRYDPYEYNF